MSPKKQARKAAHNTAANKKRSRGFTEPDRSMTKRQQSGPGNRQRCVRVDAGAGLGPHHQVCSGAGLEGGSLG
jgi:hypothetical protein